MNEVKFRLSQPQLSVKTSRASIILDMAGQRGGKTLNISLDVIEKVRSVPQAVGFIGANTYKQLSQTTLKVCFDNWKNFAGWEKWSKHNPNGVFVFNQKPPPHFRQYQLLDSYSGTICFQNGALIFTGSLTNYLAHDGKEFGWAHLDETKDTNPEALTGVIFARLSQMGIWCDINAEGQPYFYDKTISDDEADERGLVSWNPCYIHTSPSLGDLEWLIDLLKMKPFEKEITETLQDPYKYVNKKYSDKHLVIYQTYWNEANLKRGYLQGRKLSMTEEEVSLFIDGNPFAKTGAEFFNEFQKRNTVVEKVPIHFDRTFNMTWDFNASPYTTLLVGQTDYIVKFYNSQTGEKKDYLEEGDEGFAPLEVMRLFLQKEFLDYDGETTGSCRAFSDWLEINEAKTDLNLYGDASGRNRMTGMGSLTNFKLIEQSLEDKYFVETMAKKSNISIKLRRNFMNRLFAGKIPEIEFYIAEECEQTIRDLQFLKKAPDGSKFKEKEKDPHTGKEFEKIGHCFVGETLIETSEGKKRIDEIKVGDFVHTRKGLKKVLNVWDNGIKNVRKYTMNGKVVECTDNHLIFTKNRGFVKAFELNEEDKFLMFENNNVENSFVSDEKTRLEKVFDLEIEDEHEYFANEILVHNCADALEYWICELCRDWLKE